MAVGAFAQSEQKKSKYPMRFSVMLNAGISQCRQPAFGFTVAHAGLFGYYVNAMIGLDNIHLSYDYHAAADGSLMEGENAGTIPFYSGQRAHNHFAVTTGAIFRMGIPLYAYVGGGYAHRTETRELLNRQWVQAASSLGHSGVVDVGLMSRVDNFSIMAGYALYIGQQMNLYHEAKVGIGYTFNK